MSKPMSLQDLESLKPGSSRVVTTAVLGLIGFALNRPWKRMRFEVEGWEHMPNGPAVIVANHTHWLDWLPLRWLGLWRGRTMCNWVKPRTYEEGWGPFLNATGNLPVVSRGYLLAADVRSVHGRAPDESEYRALRNHLDSGEPFPDGEFFDKIAQTPRDILGMPFDPSTTDWRDCVETLFHRMMSATLAHTAALCDKGSDLQIMPQGVTSMRLTKGHPGALQAAFALDLPLVPVGISGYPQAYGERGKIFPQHGGTVRVRVGPAWTPEPIEGHIPFLPKSERAHAEALERGTEEMMRRIAPLVDERHSAKEGHQADFVGVARFL